MSEFDDGDEGEEELLQHDLFSVSDIKVTESFSKNKKTYHLIMSTEGRELNEMQIYLALGAHNFEKGIQLGVHDELPEAENREKELDN